MDKCCLFTLILNLTRNQYGMISVVGPAFVNREVTLKATPFHPWGCDVAWRYMMDGNTYVQTMNGADVKRYSEDGSFFLKWKASSEYNGSIFYAECSSNKTIRTTITSLNMKDIEGQCGALMILSPVVRGAEVKLGYFPSDQSIKRKDFTWKWKKDMHELQLRNGSYEEDVLSNYLYILTIFNFRETFEGSYILNCNSESYTNLVQLQISDKPSYPVLGPMSPDFITTECIYVYRDSDVYCQTELGTEPEPVQVLLLIGQDSFVLPESEGNKGSYRFHNVNLQMAGLSRQNVTCQVFYSALETPYEVHGTLCNVEKGNPPVLTLPEFLDGESSTTICDVHNAIPAPEIKIHVGTVLLADVDQTDIYNESSHTYTSRAKVTETHKTWNGKELCCTSRSKVDIGFKNVSICRNISMMYPPSDLSICVNKIHGYNNNVSVRFFSLSCETNQKSACKIEWSNDNGDLRNVHRNNWTYGKSGNYRSFSNVLYKVVQDSVGRTITCSTRCDYFPLHLNKKYKVSCSEATTISASVVTQQWHTLVLYVLSAALLLSLVTTLTVLLLWRFKPHAYEKFLHRRRPACTDPSINLYDAVQPSVHTTALHDLVRLKGTLSASAFENTSPRLGLEEHQVSSNKIDGHYDYIDSSFDVHDHGNHTPAGTYIHAI
ncbi:uncharacterized protein LOC128235264 isoform X2 [Mya arenaria]|uniref:uncharacterized protein LOC128235264 isoform X2 n=1 Tax=Mya arenaria TaxID=6604 RepID=UPI0022E186A2|nr:uncharacterized protein LOC128235264 isoform X2 [Mya arenaria]